MRMIMTPGYKSLFGEASFSYEELLEEVSSETIIMVLLSINAELNTSEGSNEKQKRIWQRISHRFTNEQRQRFHFAFSKYNAMANGFDGTLFDRSCLLEMILKELERNNVCDNSVDVPIHEYYFVLAYLLFVDEVRKKDSELLNDAKKYKNEVMPTLPLLWAGGIRQYEFSQTVNIAYELFKLICFSKFAKDKFGPYLKELINKYSFKNISQFVGSFYQVLNVTLIDNPNEPLRKLVSINPGQAIDKSHLRAMCCNLLLGKQKLIMRELRKYPLFETSMRGFMIVDEDMFRKKVYKGPLFELQKETSLEGVIKFEDYKTTVSKEFYETLFFRSIVKLLCKSKHETLQFDDDTLNKPDLFYRYGKTVLLFEFKDYLFPDKIIAGREYSAFKKYIDERFVLSDKEKPKGIGQLTNNIDRLYKLKYDFDLKLNELIKTNQQVNIYPIICHTDFMFSMPGINEYLNIMFIEKIREKRIESKFIGNITVISLEVLFDYGMRGNDFISLSRLIERYWGIISKRKKKNEKSGSIDNFLATTVSFDEMYETKFKQELFTRNQVSKGSKLNLLSQLAGLTQEEFERSL